MCQLCLAHGAAIPCHTGQCKLLCSDAIKIIPLAGPLHIIDAIIPPAHEASPSRVGLSSVHHEIGRKGTVIKVRRIHDAGTCRDAGAAGHRPGAEHSFHTMFV